MAGSTGSQGWRGSSRVSYACRFWRGWPGASWQYSEDDDFLSEVYPGLLRFFERWLACDADKDGFPEWQSEGQTGYPFMPTFALGLPWGQNADIRTVETPDLLAYLLSEATSLREIAYYLRKSDDEKKLGARADELTARLETLWNAQEGRYAYRDRDTHQTTGSVSVLQDGRGDEDHILALRLTPPNRLIVEVTGGTSQPAKMKLHLSGVDASGNRVQEDADAFVWTPEPGRLHQQHSLLANRPHPGRGHRQRLPVSARTMATEWLRPQRPAAALDGRHPAGSRRRSDRASDQSRPSSGARTAS